jgi:uncharacterized protein Yka (UPF0111/DUF47 family)
MSDQSNRIADALERIADNLEYLLEDSSDNLEKIVEQLELINSPEKDREFNKWFYFWKKRINNTKNLIKIYSESGKLDRVEYYTKQLEELEKESFEG